MTERTHDILADVGVGEQVGITVARATLPPALDERIGEEAAERYEPADVEDGEPLGRVTVETETGEVSGIEWFDGESR